MVDRRLFLKAAAASAVASKLDESKANTSIPPFNQQRALEDLAIANLPIDYESIVTKFSWNSAEQDSEAKKMIKARLPKDARFTVIRHGHITAVVVYEPSKSRITYAFDGTGELRDFADNYKSKPFELSGGRKAHTGYYSALEMCKNENMQPSIDNPTMYDAVKRQIEEYATLQSGPVELDATGFSKGGSVSQLMLDRLMDDKISSNIKFSYGHPIASPSFADAAWVDAFEAKCAKLGVTNYRVVECNDPVPLAMTETTAYRSYKYTQTKNVVHLMANPDLSSARMWVNPERDDLEQIKDEKAKLVAHPHPHDQGWYAQLLGAQLAVAVNGQESPDAPHVSRLRLSAVAVDGAKGR